MTLAQKLELLTTILLSSYFLIITFSFFKFRLVRKQEELNSILGNLNLANSKTALNKHLAKEFSKNDYILPVVFVTIISSLGIFLLLLGWMLYDYDASEPIKSMLWSGSDFWADPVYGREKKSLAIVAWAIVGGFMNGAQYIYRRYTTVDLTPSNFFSVGIRMVVAATISLMISYVLGMDALNQSGSNTILVIAFLTGMFPERGMRFLLDKTKQLLPGEHKAEASNLPLEAIEGISYFHRLRLNEVGIDNVQNLAHYNFLLLIIKTPFPMRILLDWVAQAKLQIEFHEEVGKLHKVGIRSALDLTEAVDGDISKLDRIAQASGIEPLSLEINYNNISKDKSVWLLDQFKTHLEEVRFG
ncbi:hypothetical protein [Roseivirga sp.]|uniref:hypothetical protein n=1 Tax=Roseivirga sp. TaxID=1964215 RepID=UPI003B51B3D4